MHSAYALYICSVFFCTLVYFGEYIHTWVSLILYSPTCVAFCFSTLFISFPVRWTCRFRRQGLPRLRKCSTRFHFILYIQEDFFFNFLKMYIYRAHPGLTSLFSRALGDVRVSNCGHVRTPTRTLHLALARAFYLSRARARAGTRRCRWIESRIRTAQKQWAWRIKSFPCQCQLQPIHLRVPLFGSDCSHKWMGRFSCVHALYLCARLFSPPNLTGNFYGGFFISDW